MADFPSEIKDIQICTQHPNYSDIFIPAPIVMQKQKGVCTQRECNNDDDKMALELWMNQQKISIWRIETQWDANELNFLVNQFRWWMKDAV